MHLSIITINRNNAEGLRKTIESVVSQTYTDFEYIIIDGASTDDSVNIIKEYAEATLPCGEGLGDRLYWVSEPDKGIYNAMNKGILKAKGEYLLFLNSGDWLVDENKIQLMVNNLNNEDILIANMYLVDDDHSKKNNYIGIYPNDYSNDEITAIDLIFGAIPHNTSFIKKDLFLKNGLYDETYQIVSDWKFLIKNIVFNNASTKVLRNIFVTNFDMSGISTNNIELNQKERELVLNEFFSSTILKDYNAYYQLYLQNESIQKRYKDYMVLRNNKFFLIFIRTFLWLHRKFKKGR